MLFRSRSRTGRRGVGARQFWRRDQKDLPKGGGMSQREVMGDPVGRWWRERSPAAWPSHVSSKHVDHYTAAHLTRNRPNRIDILNRVLLKLPAHYRQSSALVLHVTRLPWVWDVLSTRPLVCGARSGRSNRNGTVGCADRRGRAWMGRR